MGHTPVTRERELAKRKQLRQSWFKANGPCRHFGSDQNLELDHTDRATKVAGSHHLVWSWSRQRRENELRKCQPLCRSCHRAKTSAETAVPLPHGAHSGYSYHGCRCTECRTEHARYQRNWYRGEINCGPPSRTVLADRKSTRLNS